jgi:hypothetical protein
MASRLRSFTRRCRISLALIAGITAAVAAPSPASAATQIGETFAPSETCDTNTVLQTGSPGGQYTVQAPGVITSWSFLAPATPPTQLRLKVARPAPGDGYFTIVGQSDVQAPVANVLNTYPIQISVQPGDVIGFFFSPASQTCSSVPVDSGYSIGYYGAAGTDVQPGPPQFFISQLGVKLDISAAVEPDCDSDGFGDETQDADISSCPQPEPEPQPKADGTLTIDANKGKVEKGRKVTLTGQLDVSANESCEPGRTIQVQRRLKSEDDSKFATFRTVQTDASGNYSTKVKVKKTYFYRAVVQENAACDDELSNTQKVRVQKKKAAQEA